MSEEKFDVIIVGAGLAGSIAGYILAQNDMEVLIIERGDTPGSKNMTGGRLYAHSLEKIIPGFAQEAPIERKVTKEMISMLTPNSSISLDFQSQLMTQEGKDSYTVLRAEFDAWLAEKAEEAGAIVASGVLVDDLLWRDGKVVGVIAGEDEMEADVVILADGVNSLLAQKAKLKPELKSDQVAVGVKEVIELPEKVIEDRFNLKPGEGAARLFAGECSKGKIGGGFLYTNKNSLSLGLVITVSEMVDSSIGVPEMMEEFKNHPLVQTLVEGGKTVEYSAHLVPEAGINMLPEIVADGVLVTGDAAGLVINVGYTIRGMDLAIASGELAAKAVIQAKEKNDFSKASLSVYETMLKDSFVFKDLQTYRKAPKFMENHRMFNEYPGLAESVMVDLFTVTGEPVKPLKKRMLGHVRKVGMLNLAKDAWKGAQSL